MNYTPFDVETWGGLNIKMPSTSIGIPMLNVARPSYLWHANPYLGKTVFILKRAQNIPVNLCQWLTVDGSLRRQLITRHGIITVYKIYVVHFLPRRRISTKCAVSAVTAWRICKYIFTFTQKILACKQLRKAPWLLNCKLSTQAQGQLEVCVSCIP